MKVLRGALRETVYRFPDEAALRRGDLAPPAVERQRVLRENEVGYICSAFLASVEADGRLTGGRFDWAAQHEERRGRRLCRVAAP